MSLFLTSILGVEVTYKHNPKTRGSGIICAIPQTGVCPVGCADCFFQSGRSYLEPLSENLPNVPSPSEAHGRVIRINDGNDSNVDRPTVMATTYPFQHYFFNTSIPKNLAGFKRPIVLTVNPGGMTDKRAHLLKEIPPNLMFVRVRTNTWNLKLIRRVVRHYTGNKKTPPVPVILTFMAYYTQNVPEGHEDNYEFRKRTMNSYWVIRPESWRGVMDEFTGNQWVYGCGKDAETFSCARCGNCIREYFVTMERIRELIA